MLCNHFLQDRNILSCKKLLMQEGKQHKITRKFLKLTKFTRPLPSKVAVKAEITTQRSRAEMQRRL